MTELVPLLSYDQALERQRQPNSRTIIFRCQPVFTVGTRGHARYKDVNHINQVPVVLVDRGGDITYHGPGQLVVFPVFDLRQAAQGPFPVRWLTDYLIGLSEAVFRALDPDRDYFKDAENPGLYRQGPMGVEKVASVGFRITKAGIAHGLAMNIQADHRFHWIAPCNLDNVVAGALYPAGQDVDWSPVVAIATNHENSNIS